MKTFFAHRIAGDGQSSVSRWVSDAGVELCFCLQPGFDRKPFPGIPEGTYPLRFRTFGAKHKAYLGMYGKAFHKGMIEICDVPGRTAIEFHVGNTIADTKGCFLCGEAPLPPPGNGSGHYEVTRSRVTYEKAYPILRDAILAGPVQLTIIPVGAMS